MQDNISQQKTTEEGVRENVLNKIRAGEVRMTPKTYFILKVILMVVVAILALLVSAFLLSFIIFGLRISGRLFLLGFGLRGFGIFLLTFPWFILALDIVLIIILERLLKRFKFAYRSPLTHTFLGLIILTVLVGLGIYFTPFHSFLLRRAEEDHLPVVGGMYRDAEHMHPDRGIFKGMVMSVEGSSFAMQDEDGDAFVVIAPPGFDISMFLHPGDEVFVAGMIDGKEIRAYGISKIDNTNQ